MSELTPEEFTQLVLIAAAPPNRVGELVARLVGERITIGPIAVGPGGMGSATAWGTVFVTSNRCSPGRPPPLTGSSAIRSTVAVAIAPPARSVGSSRRREICVAPKQFADRAE